jgi:formylglycine-generating enzyme required for sulfatase activity
MPRIFISYRREDSAFPVQHLYEKLVNRFGKESVIFDVDTIPLGSDFPDYLAREVSKCDVLLAVIGDRWLDILKQRLNDPNDFIRIEIQAALERKIPVVPVLLNNASLPNEKDLPKELAGLVYKQAAKVRAGSIYQSDLKRLIDGLGHLLPVLTPDRNSIGEKAKKHKKAVATFKSDFGMQFVLIPAGSFKMGGCISLEEVVHRYGGSEDWYKSELPRHYVEIIRPFYLQITQVTQRQWEMVMDKNVSEFKNCGEKCPIENVSWNDTQEFIKKLNGVESTSRHFEYRLPSEAEWEYACRAGTTTEFSFGDNVEQLVNYAWVFDNSEKKTHLVGTKNPNPWSLYDMHGNVWEWVEDNWHYNYEGAPKDGTPWVDDPIGPDRVVRGGGWSYDAQNCRSSNRNSARPDYSGNSVGFRLARSAPLDP